MTQVFLTGSELLDPVIFLLPLLISIIVSVIAFKRHSKNLKYLSVVLWIISVIFYVMAF